MYICSGDGFNICSPSDAQSSRSNIDGGQKKQKYQTERRRFSAMHVGLLAASCWAIGRLPKAQQSCHALTGLGFKAPAPHSPSRPQPQTRAARRRTAPEQRDIGSPSGPACAGTMVLRFLFGTPAGDLGSPPADSPSQVTSSDLVRWIPLRCLQFSVRLPSSDEIHPLSRN